MFVCFRGPTILTIQDAGNNVATANGDVNVGNYVFKLIVKDKEELTASATLNINVKQGIVLLCGCHEIINNGSIF